MINITIEQAKVQEQSEQTTSKIVYWLLTIVPVIILFGTFFLFQFDESVKYKIVNVFQNLNQLDFKTSSMIMGLGFSLIILNFPFLIFEMCLGYTFTFSLALAYALVSKIIAEICTFCLARFVMKHCCLQIIRNMPYFKFIEKAATKYPWQIANLIRANAIIPLFVINFGCGLVQIGFLQYLTSALIWGAFYSSCMIYFGSQLLTLKQVIDGTNVPAKQNLLYFEITVGIISLIAIVYIVFLSQKYYKEIQTEIDNDEQQQQQIQINEVSTEIKELTY